MLLSDFKSLDLMLLKIDSDRLSSLLLRLLLLLLRAGTGALIFNFLLLRQLVTHFFPNFVVSV